MRTSSFRERAARPLSLLVLLGFVCQGLTWDNYLMPVLFTGLWMACLSFQFQGGSLNRRVELGLYCLSMLAAYGYGGDSIFNKSVFGGNGLLLLQCAWLARKLDPREERMAIAVALTHLAIASLIVFGYEFLPILLAAFILAPAAFFDVSNRERGGGRWRFRSLMPASGWAAIALVVVGFFLFAPRRELRIEGGGGDWRRRGESPSMDTASGGGDLGDKILFRVVGDHLGLMKTMTFDTFDGNTWSASRGSFALGRRRRPPDASRHLYRKVLVDAPRDLGGHLPVDGKVVNLSGNFFNEAHITVQGCVVVTPSWIDSTCYYEYWTEISPEAEVGALPPRESRAYLAVPWRESRVEALVISIAPPDWPPRQRADAIANFLRSEFEYELGGPDLSRLNPLGEFLFERRRGHCERFASAMAYMSRLAGIPARVAVGYAPHEKNLFSNLYKVSSADAHAWVEAYLPGRGWTAFDPTPFQEVRPRDTTRLLGAIYDWIEHLWFGRIVNYTASERRHLISWGTAWIGGLVEFLARGAIIPTLAVIAAATAWFFRRRIDWRGLAPRFTRPRRPGKNRPRGMVEECYHRMWNLLENRGLRRLPSQTPFEYARLVAEARPAIAAETGEITNVFCAVKYGMRPPNERQLESIAKHLRAIEQKLAQTPDIADGARP